MILSFSWSRRFVVVFSLIQVDSILLSQTFEVAPDVLKEHGKVSIVLFPDKAYELIVLQTKNPYPNVDAASGCVLYHYGLTQFKVCTSCFVGCPRLTFSFP